MRTSTEREHQAGARSARPTPLQRLAEVLDPLPPVFAGRWPKPLAIGLGKALLAAAPIGTRTRLRFALKCWARSPAYQAQLCRPGAMRHGLDGEPVEPVSEEHAQYARRQRAAKRQGKRPHRRTQS